MILIQMVGWVLLGGAVLIGGVVGLCILIARSTEHNQATCDCVDCRQRRMKAWYKQQKKLRPGQTLDSQYPKKPVLSDSGWLTTRELRIEMVMDHKGNRYQVTDLAHVDNGMLVSLSHIPTRKRSIVPVSHRNLDRRMWHVEKPRWP